MDRIAEVEIRKCDKLLYFKVSKDVSVEKGDFVIVEFTQGTIDWGRIYSFVETKGFFPHTISGKVLRKITDSDRIIIEENNAKKKDVFDIFNKKIKQYHLNMKLVDVEYSFDRTRITFYYWADGRIDFRNLVKDLAKIFNCRIEMKQIGLRDEAKIKGGYGICGQPLCCYAFLKKFDTITMRFVKTQKLPLDMHKITGICGRLLCCLRYEDEFYKKEKVGKK